MTTEAQRSEGPGLKHLDGKPFEELLDWLERALRRDELLPVVIPGESPEDAILRHERALDTMTRRDLVKACQVLVRRFVREPSGGDDEVAALLRLAKGFELEDLASDLHALASDEERFARVPAAQQRTVLTTLFDTRAPLPVEFWHGLVRRDPARFGSVAFSGLLREQSSEGLRMLQRLPNEEPIADAIYVILGQFAQSADPKAREKLIGEVIYAATHAQPLIRAALEDWAGEQSPVRQESPAARNAGLDAALRRFNGSRNKPFKPSPRPARIVPRPSGMAA